MKVSENHHAYLIESEVKEGIDLVRSSLTEDTDCRVIERDTFGIDESREVKEASVMAATAASPRVFILAGFAFTIEAQNALLKTLEEPLPHVRFFIVTPTTDGLLETFLSRLAMLGMEKKEDRGTEVLEAFLAAAPVARIRMLRPYVEATDDEDERRKRKQELTGFIRRLGQFVHDRKGSLAAGKTIALAERMLRQSSALPRIVAEHVSIALEHPIKHT